MASRMTSDLLCRRLRANRPISDSVFASNRTLKVIATILPCNTQVYYNRFNPSTPEKKDVIVGRGRGFGALVSVFGQTTACVLGKVPWSWPSWEKAVFVIVIRGN